MPQNVFDQFDEETVEANVFDQFDTPATPIVQPVEAPEAAWGERAADIGIDLAKGTVGFGQAVVGLGSMVTGGYLSDGMRALGYNPEQTNQFLSDMYSEARKAEEEKISKAEGFVGTVEEIVTQPGALVGKIAETTPMMLGSIAAARLFAAKAFAAAEAEALAAGATKAAASKVGLEASAKAATTAAATAEGAQQAGMSFDDYMDKGIDLGKAYVASIGSGITTGLTSLIGGRIGQKFGFGDVEAGVGGKGGIISRAAKGGVQEGVLEEMPQSSMEQMWNNYANERPIMEGVPEAAGTGLTVGFGAGTGFGAFQKAPAEQTDQETKPPETFSPTHNVSGGVAAEQATKNGLAIPDTYVDASGKIIRDANAVPIPIPEYDPESYDLEQNAAAIEADVAAGAPTAEGRQGIIESVFGPGDVLRPGTAPGALDIARQAEIERTPLEVPVEPEPVEIAEEPTAPLPVDVNEQIAILETQADEAGITDPVEKRQFVIEELYGRKTPEERRQDEINRLRTGTIEEPIQTAEFAREQMAKRLPENLRDPRLGRETHRLALEGMLGDLTPGGGIAVVPDEMAIRGEGDVSVPMKRTPSLNPPWAQAILSDESVTVNDMSKAVNAALSGEKLGVRQARVVSAMLDQITGERTAPAVVEYAINARQEAQALRREAVKSDEGVDTAGEVYEEVEYEPEWDGEGRAFYEIYKQAEEVDAAATEDLFDSMYETDSNLENIAVELHKQIISKGEPDAREPIDERIVAEADIERPEDQEKIKETEAGAASADEIAEAAAAAEGHTASEAQIEANNYKKGHISNLQGMKISIENEAGTRRRPEWPPLAHTYGDIVGTVAADGDPVDVFIKKDVDIPVDNPIYVINQNDQGTDNFDEIKVMVGFSSMEDARKGYLDSYTEDFDGFGSIVEATAEEFNAWLKGDTTGQYPTGKTEKERALAAKAKKKTIISPINNVDKPSLIIDDKDAFDINDELPRLKKLYADGNYLPVSDGASSPWLLYDGKLVMTGQDHVGYAMDYGLDTYGEFSRETGAIRFSYFTNPADGRLSVTAQIYEGQAVSNNQIKTIKKILDITDNSELAVGISKSTKKTDLENPEYQFMEVNELIEYLKTEKVPRATTAKPVEEPTVTPEEITELPAVDYARFDGKEITYEVEIEETGETYTVTADAGKEMRGIDARIESLNELMKCVS